MHYVLGMATAMIDTLQVSHRLRAAGASQPMADAVASTFAEQALLAWADLVTGSMLALQTERLEKLIEKAQNRILVAVGGMLITAVTVLFALLKV